MRAAFITLEYPCVQRGVDKYAVYLTRELAKLGHEIIVFTAKSDETELEKCNIKNLQVRRVKIRERLPYPGLQFWLLLPGAVKKAEKERAFDIIHFNGYSYAFLKKKISKAPHVVTAHHLVKDVIENSNQNIIQRLLNVSRETSIFAPLIEKRVVTNAQKIISVSDFTKNQITETYKISPDEIETIHHGVKLDGYTFAKQELGDLRKALQLPQTPIILFVGAVDDARKGLDFLLKAFKKLVERTNATLLIVGTGNNIKAKKVASSLGILKNVVFTGAVDEVTLKKCFALCDIYVFPSRLEGFGLPLLEATAAGKPIIATKVGAIPELVKLGISATLVDPDDVNALSDYMFKFLQEGSLDEYPKRSAMEALKKFSWETTAKKTSNLYKTLIEMEYIDTIAH